MNRTRRAALLVAASPALAPLPYPIVAAVILIGGGPDAVANAITMLWAALVVTTSVAGAWGAVLFGVSRAWRGASGGLWLRFAPWPTLAVATFLFAAWSTTWPMLAYGWLCGLAAWWAGRGEPPQVMPDLPETRFSP